MEPNNCLSATAACVCQNHVLRSFPFVLPWGKGDLSEQCVHSLKSQALQVAERVSRTYGDLLRMTLEDFN